MTHSEDASSEFGRLMDEFLARVQRGEAPEPEDYALRYPQFAGEIRQVFPTLRLLEEFGTSGGSRDGGLAVSVPRQLGEYLVLREVGRGGMGVVYEAVQQSLGRHVALKVLSPQLHQGAAHYLRFRREAQAVARLHHTNIVPVFAVGEEDGTLFYAMQYIRGQTLAAILDELRAPALASPSATTVTLLGDAIDTRFRVGDSPASSQLGLRDLSRHIYFQNVARLGAQVADALDYSHREGVIHRDVKPSNLLLDTSGVPWVTDFGLAKVATDDGLTQTGAILGTLAYMAPEQFAGEATPRSDVYSLGVTLYELVTLRPAHRDDNKLRLMDRIRTEAPPPPRSIVSAIPRDLETVILKAMATEPARRYATAGELAADLRRFLDGRTVLARRASWPGQGWRWCKRNRTVASLLAGLVVTLAALAAGATAVAVRNEREAVAANERAWRAKLDEAEAVAGSDRLGQRFQALRLLTEALGDARVRGLTPADEVRFRSVAASALCRPDLELERTWGDYQPRTYGWESELDFSPSLEEYATVGPGSVVQVRRTDDDRVVAELPVAKLPARVRYSPDGSALAVLDGINANANTLTVWTRTPNEWTKRWSVRAHLSESFDFSADGSRIAYLDVAARSVRVVEWATENHWEHVLSAPFDDRWIVCFAPDGRVIVPDPGHKGGRFLAWTVGRRPVALPIPSVGEVNSLSWDRESRAVAVGSWTHTAVAYDAESGQPIGPTLLHPNNGVVSRFPGTQGRLLTNDWTNRLRMWDVPTGRQLFNTPSLGSIVRVNAAGDRLATLSDKPDGKSRLFRFAAGDELARVVTRDAANRATGVGQLGCWFSPTDGVIVAGVSTVASDVESGGFVILDRRSGRVLASFTEGQEQPLRFLADGSLLTVSPTGVRRWPRTTTPQGVRFGPPAQTIPQPKLTATLQAASGDGRVVASVTQNSPTQVRVASTDSGAGRVIRTPSQIHRIAVSPDGRWLLTGAEKQKSLGPNVRVYDLRTGELATELSAEGQTRVGFSPEGRWMWASGSGGTARLWRTGTWEPGIVVNGHTVAFTADGALMATDDGFGAIRLLEPETGRVVVRIQVPEADFVWPVMFDPSTGHLAAYCPDSWMLLLLDVGRVRRGLAGLGLDWPSPRSVPLPVPEVVEIDLGLNDNRKLAVKHLLARRYQACVRHLQWALRDDPADIGTLLKLAELRVLSPYETLDLAEGQQYLEKLISLVPDPPIGTASAQEKSNARTLRLLQTALVFRRGDYVAARDQLTEGLATRSSVSSLQRLLLALCHHHLGDAEAARRKLAEDERLARTAALSAKMLPIPTWFKVQDEALRDEAIMLIRKP